LNSSGIRCAHFLRLIPLPKGVRGKSQTYPPDGESKVWWKRLKKALGTKSSDFVNASLSELQAAAHLPFGGISEVGMNAALALIEAAAPRNEIESALAVQMACTHTAALAVLARFSGGGGSERRVVALASAAARLMRAYSGQVETLRRLRHGGDQHVRVEHIHINEGAQAVIGSVRAPDRRHEAKRKCRHRINRPIVAVANDIAKMPAWWLPARSTPSW
jgi:hypothetical protein